MSLVPALAAAVATFVLPSSSKIQGHVTILPTVLLENSSLKTALPPPIATALRALLDRLVTPSMPQCAHRAWSVHTVTPMPPRVFPVDQAPSQTTRWCLARRALPAPLATTFSLLHAVTVLQEV